MSPGPAPAVRRVVAEAVAAVHRPGTVLRGVLPAVLDGAAVGTWYGTDGDPRPVRRRRRALVSGAWVAALAAEEGTTALRHPGGVLAWAESGTPPHERAYLLRSVVHAALWTTVGLVGELPRRRRLRGASPATHRRLGVVVGLGYGLTALPVHLARAGAADDVRDDAARRLGKGYRASATGTR
jgi:hypothetical protein